MPAMRNEVHVVNAPNGHHDSVDCWCEPYRIHWVTNQHGIRVLIVEHDDNTLTHRRTVIAERSRRAGIPDAVNHPDASWITRVLHGPPWGTPLLPPHQDPNERNV